MIAVGVGCSLGCSAEELLDLVDASLALAGAADGDVVALATVDRRADEPGVVEAARRRGWPLVTFPAEELAAVAVPTPSAVVAAHVGTPSVAEASALLAARATALAVRKQRSPHATCAIARNFVEGSDPFPNTRDFVKGSDPFPNTRNFVEGSDPFPNTSKEDAWPA